MARFVASASVSLDGFVAHDDHTVDPLFDWYEAGSVEVENAGDLPPFHLTDESAAHWTEWVSSLGALLVGRTLFDVTNGWGGTHPLDVPVVVVSSRHRPADWEPPGSERFTFVDDVRDAAQAAAELAGDRVVGVAAGTVAGQLLELGLLDAVAMDVVPVWLGRGRPFFARADGSPLDATHRLGDPTRLVRSARVTHMVLPVVR